VRFAACLPGCTSCSSTACTQCETGLEVSSSNPLACQPAPFLPTGSANSTFTTCSDGQFALNGACTACDPVCSTCFGAGPNSCLDCASPRSLLAGTCVTVDQGTGICDKSTAINLAASQKGDNANWVVDNSKNECDGKHFLSSFVRQFKFKRTTIVALPAKCAAGQIPNFSSTAARSSLQCTACSSGAFLSNGACLATCPSGTVAQGGSCVGKSVHCFC
jgi:hypothetical protein